jgi:hypothetical protein
VPDVVRSKVDAEPDVGTHGRGSVDDESPSATEVPPRGDLADRGVGARADGVDPRAAVESGPWQLLNEPARQRQAEQSSNGEGSPSKLVASRAWVSAADECSSWQLY